MIEGRTTIGEIIKKGGDEAKKILKKYLGGDIFEKRNIELTHLGEAARNAFLGEEKFAELVDELNNL